MAQPVTIVVHGRQAAQWCRINVDAKAGGPNSPLDYLTGQGVENQLDRIAALDVANELARAWLAGTGQRLVTASADAATVLASLPAALPSTGMEPAAVLRELAACAEPGLAGTGSGRYLALVTGGVLPSALGADWLVSAWDQNASFGELYPAAVAIEHAAGRWILDLLDLPEESAVGFTTGAQGANTATLLAARNAVLAAHGYDVEAHGLQGAPRVNVVVLSLIHL